MTAHEGKLALCSTLLWLLALIPWWQIYRDSKKRRRGDA